MTDILQSARSYYGLADANVRKSEWFTDNGQQIICFEIIAEGEDFIGIVERMKSMQEAESQQVEQAPIFGEDLDTHAMRQKYNALSKAERGKYGSFGKYMMAMSNGIIEAEALEQGSAPGEDGWPTFDELSSEVHSAIFGESVGTGGRKVAHIDAPETEEPTTMDAVWLSIEEANFTQREYSSGYHPEKGFLVRWHMLTEEQRQKAKEKL